jgi:hypothetical protein
MAYSAIKDPGATLDYQFNVSVRIPCRADPHKTYYTTRPTTCARAPMLRGPIGPVGFIRC